LRVRVEVTGIDDVIRSIQRMGIAGKNIAKAVLLEHCQEIVPLAQARTPVEPVDGGALRDSIRAIRPTITPGGAIGCGVVAGGQPLAGKIAEGHHHANVYAIVQHEDLTLKHTVGGPKYLEIPFFQKAPEFPEKLMRAFDRELKP
jgi:hypothetical protein